MNENPKYQRVKLWAAAGLVLLALLIDLIAFILGLLGIGEVIDSVIGPAADFLFVFLFWMQGVTYTKNPKRLSIMIIIAIIGMIPFLNLLPELTLGIIATILSVWEEDKNAIIPVLRNRVSKYNERNGLIPKGTRSAMKAAT